MTPWMSDEVNKIGRADELEIAPLGRNGTPQKPVTIWVVRIGDHLYVRSYKGHGGAWFRAAQARQEGRIRAGGIQKNVRFVEENDPGVNDQIDTAYRTKYRSHGAQYVDAMVAPEARATTMKLVPGTKECG